MKQLFKHDYSLNLNISVESHEEDAASALEHPAGWAEAIDKLETLLEALKEGNKLALAADCTDTVVLPD